jgi:hypothetical protein
MDEDLVLLTSYFNLANGRRQDTADTFRVDPSLPSSTSPDGTAALYLVTEASTGGSMGPRVRRLAADTIAWEYSTHSQDQPATRLKAALRAAHEQIRADLDGHVSVGASVIAVEHKDVFLAQVAPAQVYVMHEGSLHSISATVGGASPYANALGSTRGPEISLFRDKVEPGDMLSLCSSWFHQSADPEELRDCFGAGSADDVAEALLELARDHDVRDASVIVVEVANASDLEVSPEGAAPGFLEQIDDAVQALANVGRLILAELRPGTSGAVRNGRSAGASSVLDEEYAPRDLSPHSALGEQATSEVPQVSTREMEAHLEPYSDEAEEWFPERTATIGLDDLQEAERTHQQSPLREHATEEVPIVVPEDEAGAAESLEVEADPETRERWQEPEEPSVRGGGRTITDLDEVNYRLQSDADYSEVIPPVQTFEEPSTTEPSRIYASSNRDIQKVNRRPRRFGGISRPAARDPSESVLRPSLGGLDLRKPINRVAPSWVVWLAAGVVCVFAIIAGYELLKRPHSAAATNPYPAKFVHNLALARAATVPGQQDLYLGKAQQDITLAQQFGSKRAKIQQLKREWAAARDQLYKITREDTPVLVAHFQQPTELALSSDTVYVLDAGKKGVYSVAPNSSSSPTEIIQSGEQDGGFTFDVPQHIATAGTTALALDEKNILVRYTGGTKTATLLEPPTPTEKNTAMANLGPDVFLLDSAGNQVWRYPDAVSGYNPVPGGFFSPNTPNVSQLAGFTLDDKSMFLLRGNGTILKFDTQQANPQAFQIDSAALRTALNKPDSIFTDVGLGYIWVADPGNARIVQLDKSGKYIRSYEAGTGTSMDLSQVKSIGVPPDGKTLYVLAGTQLYKFPVTP